MIDKLLQIMKTEDKKKPLTDEEIAALLGIYREQVTELRTLHKIPNSRERRKEAILEDSRKIIEKNPNISERQLLKIIRQLGYEVSRHVASQVKKEVLNNTNIQLITENNRVENMAERNSIKPSYKKVSKAFSSIIGNDRSLKPQIEQAKAAVLYPPNGLHTLIYGPSGVGKSQLAECMYNFSIESGCFKKGAPFIVFNCADYADNPQLLLSQLFGHAKGSFTGADTAKMGLVEKADGGILFLDEVHRLPNKGQEMLFRLIDKGTFRRLGEVEDNRKVKVMVIAATTEDPESTLLLTFRRRIPVAIELPSLSNRTYLERFEIIKSFFSKEASRIGKTIVVKKDVLRILMTYKCPGNIGQLRSDIQVACANGLLSSMGNENDNITINVSNLTSHIKTGLFGISKRYPDIERFISNDLVLYPNKLSDYLIKDDRYMLPQKIYKHIEQRFRQLQKQGFGLNEINTILEKEIKPEIEKFEKNVSNNNFITKKDLEGIVGEEIIEVVDNVFKISKEYIHDIHDSFYYFLAIHLNSTYERLKSGREIINPQLEKIKSKYFREYEIAKKISEEINKQLNINLPDDEVGFIAMYLKTFSNGNDDKKGRVGVIVLTHGHVATAMVDVANKLLGVNHAVGIEMSLEESPELALEKTIKAVKEKDEGKGCLILVDMGSLITFGEIITQKTGIPTKIIGRVDTVMVLEAIRRAIIPDSELDEIAEALDGDKKYVGKVVGVNYNKRGLPKAIVTVCITGEGTAIKMKKYIEDLLPEAVKQIDIIPLGVISNEEINTKIMEIRKEKNIVAFIGTINPYIDDIPYISVQELLNGIGIEKIKNIVGVREKTKNLLGEIIKEELILTDLNYFSKNDVLDFMGKLLEKRGFVDSNFLLSIYKREALSTTYVKGDIAVPHGNPEHVTKPAIVIAKLPKKIFWGENKKVDLIFLIAYKTDSKEYFKNFYKIVMNTKVLEKLRNAKNSKEIKDIIMSHTN